MKLKNWVRSKDVFGHRVELKFNNKGVEHKTSCGGCVSLFVITLLAMYVMILLKKLILFEDDKNNSVMMMQTDIEAVNF